MRFSPAHAGNTFDADQGTRFSGEHHGITLASVQPRACGEHLSGPRACHRTPFNRFSPAHAGNTHCMIKNAGNTLPSDRRGSAPRMRGTPASSVQPRACGEQHYSTVQPRACGEHTAFPSPAHAGNTRYASGVQPRACGEHLSISIQMRGTPSAVLQIFVACACGEHRGSAPRMRGTLAPRMRGTPL